MLPHRSRPTARFLLLALQLAAASVARATVCEGPGLHDLGVRPDGAIQVSGSEGHAAVSRDGGQHWIDLPADPGRDAAPHPFWPIALRSPNGVRYQNLVVNHEIDVVIRSRDGGATWAQVPLGQRAVLLQDDAQGAWWIAHNDLHVERFSGSVGTFWLSGAPRDSGRLEDGASGTLIEFDGRRLVTHSSTHVAPGDPLPPPFTWSDSVYVSVTGFAVDQRGTIWLSTRDSLVRGPDGGARWERVRVPPAAAWVHCNGDPPRVTVAPPPPPPGGR